MEHMLVFVYALLISKINRCGSRFMAHHGDYICKEPMQFSTTDLKDDDGNFSFVLCGEMCEFDLINGTNVLIKGHSEACLNCCEAKPNDQSDDKSSAFLSKEVIIGFIAAAAILSPAVLGLLCAFLIQRRKTRQHMPIVREEEEKLNSNLRDSSSAGQSDTDGRSDGDRSSGNRGQTKEQFTDISMEEEGTKQRYNFADVVV